jgi:hypothetical protein
VPYDITWCKFLKDLLRTKSLKRPTGKAASVRRDTNTNNKHAVQYFNKIIHTY